MSFAVVIVNYRTPELVCDCLQSLITDIQGTTNYVIIVDNCSGDNSIGIISKTIKEYGWSDWATLLPLNGNHGFAGGNNAAIKMALEKSDSYEFVMLLNPDTIIQKGALQELQSFMLKHPNTGIVGARILNENNIAESSARRFPTIFSELISAARLGLLTKLLKKWDVPLPPTKSPHPCDWVSGAAMMIRSSLFKQVGLMDDRYFLYFEELDFCYKTKKQGWEVWIDPQSVITHFEGQSTGIRKKKERRGKYWYDSRRRFFIKNHGLWYWFIADCFWFLGRLLLIMRCMLGLGGNTSNDPKHLERDLIGGDIYALLNGDALNINRYKADS